MIELKFTGTAAEVEAEVFALANTLALGRQTQHAVAQARQNQTEQVKGGEKPEAPKSSGEKSKSQPAEPPKSEDTDKEPADSADETVENAEQVPSTIDELRALAMKAMDKIGNDKAKSILQKYAPKLADIPKDKIADCGKDFLRAMDAA